MGTSSGIDWSASKLMSAATAVTPTDIEVDKPGTIGAAPPLLERLLFRLGEMPMGVGTVDMTFVAKKNVKILGKRIKSSG